MGETGGRLSGLAFLAALGPIGQGHVTTWSFHHLAVVHPRDGRPCAHVDTTTTTTATATTATTALLMYPWRPALPTLELHGQGLWRWASGCIASTAKKSLARRQQLVSEVDTCTMAVAARCKTGSGAMRGLSMTASVGAVQEEEQPQPKASLANRLRRPWLQRANVAYRVRRDGRHGIASLATS